MKETYVDFTVKDNGLIINPHWPFIGATLMEMFLVHVVERIVEIKCPYCHRGESIEIVTHDKIFYLK